MNLGKKFNMQGKIGYYLKSQLNEQLWGYLFWDLLWGELLIQLWNQYNQLVITEIFRKENE